MTPVAGTLLTLRFQFAPVIGRVAAARASGSTSVAAVTNTVGAAAERSRLPGSADAPPGEKPTR